MEFGTGPKTARDSFVLAVAFFASSRPETGSSMNALASEAGASHIGWVGGKLVGQTFFAWNIGWCKC